MTEKATIKIWRKYRDDKEAYYEHEPAVTKEVEVFEEVHGTTSQPPDPEMDWYDSGEVWTESEDVRNHQRYAIDVEADVPVTLYVHTNDSVHDVYDWDDPIERGLWFGPDMDNPPFGCEMWGRVCMWVKSRDDDD